MTFAPVRGVRAAFVFLTRVPLGGFPYTDADWAWASAHFPFVGLVVGAAVGALDVALLPLGAHAAAIVALGASMLLTGAFHEDGLADTCDALGGAYDRDKVLAILKDSRIGAFGACALVVSIGARAALLARLGACAAWAWPLVACAARVPPVVQLACMPYASAGPAAKSRQVTRGRAPQAIVAAAWLVALASALAAARVVSIARLAVMIAALAVVGVATAWRYAVRLGGVTGDFLGATEQIGEIAALAVLAWGAA